MAREAEERRSSEGEVRRETEQERFRQQELQRSEEGARRRAEEENQRRVEQEANRGRLRDEQQTPFEVDREEDYLLRRFDMPRNHKLCGFPNVSFVRTGNNFMGSDWSPLSLAR